jgi:hypothetical protein
VILVYGGIQWQMPPPNLDTFATLPNKRLKLTGPAFRGIVHLFTGALAAQGSAPCARRRSPRSLSAIRYAAHHLKQNLWLGLPKQVQGQDKTRAARSCLASTIRASYRTGHLPPLHCAVRLQPGASRPKGELSSGEIQRAPA